MKRNVITSITQDAKEDTGMYVMFADGRVFREPLIVLEGEKVERIRTGYACIWCFEPFESAFPNQCPLCLFPVADRQVQLFAKVYMGVDVPITPLSKRLEEFDEQDARDAHVKGTSILVSKDVKDAS